jgi:hypothetical protein
LTWMALLSFTIVCTEEAKCNNQLEVTATCNHLLQNPKQYICIQRPLMCLIHNHHTTNTTSPTILFEMSLDAPHLDAFQLIAHESATWKKISQFPHWQLLRLTARNDHEKDNGLYITCIGQGLALAMSHAKVLHLSCIVCHAIEFSISLDCKTANHSMDYHTDIIYSLDADETKTTAMIFYQWNNVLYNQKSSRWILLDIKRPSYSYKRKQIYEKVAKINRIAEITKEALTFLESLGFSKGC